MSLTAKQVETAKPQDKPYKLSDGRGLYLYVSKTGTKSWRTNYTINGKQKTKTYGCYPELSLADARVIHINSKESRVSEEAIPEVITFADAADKWLKVKVPTLSGVKNQIQTYNTIEKFVLPKIGAIPLNTIKRTDLANVVLAIQDKGILETAHRIASRITAIFNYAQDLGLIDVHPANGLTRVLRSKKDKKPMGSINPTETGELLSKIQEYQEPITRLGLLLMAHTFVRTTELRYMRWSEIKKGNTWVIPAERMKLRKPHTVPLSKQVKAILKELELETGGFEFVLASPVNPKTVVSENTFLFALYRMGFKGRMTGHGFRSLASTVLNEHSPFSRDVIERQLAHKETDAVHSAYNRAEYLPQRIELMSWWSDWLDSQYN